MECVRLWLFEDERGTWEKAAAEYLEATKESAAKMKLTEEQVDDQIALHLAYLACVAMRDDVMKRGSKESR